MMLTERDNNFNLLRLLAAGSVLASHSWPLTLGDSHSEILKQATGISMGHVAVLAFFVISGYLVTASWDRRPRIADFVRARLLRIYPALLVVLLFCALVLGPLASSMRVEEYFRDPAAWSYVPRNLGLVALQYELPGLFGTLPYPGVVNGSLWTLVYEVACYGGLLLLGLAGLLSAARFGWVLAALLVVLACVELAPDAWPVREFVKHTHVANFLMLAPAFAAGTAAWLWRRHLMLSRQGLMVIIPLGVASWSLLLLDIPGARLLLTIWIAWSVLWLAFVPRGTIRAFNRLGDWSYGVYIWAFPVQQTIVHAWPGIGVTGLFAAALTVTLLIGMLSWHFVEKPALSLRHRFAARTVSGVTDGI